MQAPQPQPLVSASTRTSYLVHSPNAPLCTAGAEDEEAYRTPRYRSPCGCHRTCRSSRQHPYPAKEIGPSMHVPAETNLPIRIVSPRDGRGAPRGATFDAVRGRGATTKPLASIHGHRTGRKDKAITGRAISVLGLAPAVLMQHLATAEPADAPSLPHV